MIKSLVPFSLSTNFKKAGLLALNNSAGLYGAAKSCALAKIVQTICTASS